MYVCMYVCMSMYVCMYVCMCACEKDECMFPLYKIHILNSQKKTGTGLFAEERLERQRSEAERQR